MPPELLGKIFALSSSLVWAFAVLFFKRIGETVRPVALNLYKTIIAAVLFLPLIALSEGFSCPDGMTSTDFWMLFLSGIVGITLADSIFFKSLNLLGAGLSAIVDCLYSPLLILMSCLFLGEILSLRVFSGGSLIIGAILIGTVSLKNRTAPPKNILLGTLLGAIAMVCISAGVILMKPALEHVSILWVMEIRLIAALLTLSIQVGIHRHRKELVASLVTKRTWQLALPGTILGNVLAMLFWVAAFKYTTVNSAAVLNQTSTIFIVILASIFLHEKFTVRRFFAMLLAFSGSVIVILG